MKLSEELRKVRLRFMRSHSIAGGTNWADIRDGLRKAADALDERETEIEDLKESIGFWHGKEQELKAERDRWRSDAQTWQRSALALGDEVREMEMEHAKLRAVRDRLWKQLQSLEGTLKGRETQIAQALREDADLVEARPLTGKVDEPTERVIIRAVAGVIREIANEMEAGRFPEEKTDA